jgi:hypothetical protein
MNEADVKRKIVDDVRANKGYARRIEDQFSVGFPDMIIMLPKIPVLFAEIKMVRGFSFSPSPRQHVELSRMLITSSALPVLIGHKDKVYFIHGLTPSLKSIHIDNCVQTQPNETFTETLKRWYNVQR